MSVSSRESTRRDRPGDRIPIARASFMAAVCAGLFILAGCAFDLVSLQQSPAPQTAVSADKASWRLTADTSLRPARGNKVNLKGGTEWQYVCTIKQGDVYRTKDQLVSVTASNTYEAYIVVSGKSVVGLYLPVEKSFSPLRQPTPIVMELI